jgi:hypothetical protein
VPKTNTQRDNIMAKIILGADLSFALVCMTGGRLSRVKVNPTRNPKRTWLIDFGPVLTSRQAQRFLSEALGLFYPGGVRRENWNKEAAYERLRPLLDKYRI